MGYAKPAGGRSSTARARLVITVLSCLILPSVLAAQNRTPMPQLSASLSSDNIRQGDRFSLQVEVPVRDLIGFRALSPEWPDGIQFLSGPEISRKENANLPGTTQSILVTWYLRAQQAGWHRISTFEIYSDLEAYPVSELMIPVRLPGQQGQVPPVLSWSLGASSLVQGQAVAVILELTNMLEYLPPESLSVEPPSGSVLAEVSGLGTVRSELIGGQEFQTYPVASYILTAGNPGTLVLPAASAQIYGTRVSSQPLRIEVDRLDSIVADSSGAVGEFQLSGSLSSQTVRVGEILRFTLRVEGEGNLNYLQVPEPSISGGRISSATENYRYTPTTKGYRGFREFLYRIIAEREGVLSVTLPAFRSKIPDRALVVQAPSQTLLANVEPALVNPSNSRARLAPLTPEEVVSYDMLDLYSRPESYLLIFPPAFIGIGIVLSRKGTSRKRKGRTSTLLLALIVVPLVIANLAMASPPAYAQAQRERMAVLEQAREAFDVGNAAGAIELYNGLIADAQQNNPAYYFNRGIFLASTNSHPEAVFDLRRAARMLPEIELFRDSLLILEESLGLQRQFPINAVPRGDLFFLIMLTSLTIFLLFLPFWTRDVGAAKVVVLTMMGLVFIASIVGLGVYVDSRQTAEAIVSAQDGAGQVLKIPEPNASVWLELPAGTSVRLKDKSGDFILVQTSYGIEGWVRHAGLLRAEGG